MWQARVLVTMCVLVTPYAVSAVDIDDSLMGIEDSVMEVGDSVDIGKVLTRRYSNPGSLMTREGTSGCQLPHDIQLIYRRMHRLMEYNGRRSCPRSVSNNPHDPVSERSVCPWYYEITTLDETYYPRQIWEARCMCKDCVGNSKNQCEPVQSTITLLKTRCENGMLLYEPVDKDITVGCTCVQPRDWGPGFRMF
ncbi:uncharacterized protein LOC124263008 [Haliotis rubra]|uniref:uncharacterized protein LOC124263008 n=1 Tax=Haliotis rubra TaxID=36100 RepID=UPI001EE55B82|nr:uncharacterized protein LOC124263008 [Haliotis rubra]